MLVVHLFETANKKGRIFHLYGHSWEIEKYGMWANLEALLSLIANQDNCAYLTNAEALEAMKQES